MVFEESIAHKGAPFRISLSKEGEDEYESCILLNHIPHNGTQANTKLATALNHSFLFSKTTTSRSTASSRRTPRRT